MSIQYRKPLPPPLFWGGGGCSNGSTVKASRIWGHKFHLITVNLDVDSDACVASHSICL